MLHSLVAAGANVLELGVPFSDPMSEGPVIQRGHERALANDVSLSQVLDMVAEFGKRIRRPPVVIMGYANPVERMGHADFAAACAAAGVDGLIHC
jgi:tryptophan synthase alpha chain